jgi:hypothetical protein
LGGKAMEAKRKMKNPKVLLFDCSEDIKNELTEHRFNVENATFGSDVKIELKEGQVARIPLLMRLPQNIHEFEVFIIDMCGVGAAITVQDIKNEAFGSFRFQIKYPQNRFYCSAIASQLVLLDAPKKAIYIIFSGDYFTYKCDTLDLGNPYQIDSMSGNTYDFFRDLTTYPIDVCRKHGEIVKVIQKSPLSNLLLKYESSFMYKAIFVHPTMYDTELKEDCKRSDFVPLLENKDSEIVSYICEDNGTVVLVLPQSTKKKEIIIDLLESFFPSLLPEFFPESTEFLWLTSQDYTLPNQSKYESRKLAAKEEFERTIQGIDSEIEVNYGKYRFLHDLLTGTGELLVAATVSWLKWLGFTNVVDADKEGSTLKEDIDVVEDNYIFIIEVKGIGGTSTDAECSQIGKHRRRIEKSNRGKDVYAAYIVNHQRFLPPENRANPPFTQQQIEYAENDERGLLTTYQLFLWFGAVNDGVLQKSDIMQMLQKPGLVPLIPEEYKNLGKIEVFFPKRNAFIITIKNVRIQVGNYLLLQKGSKMQRAKIISIMVSDKSIESVDNGDVGISTDIVAGKGYTVFLEPVHL